MLSGGGGGEEEEDDGGGSEEADGDVVGGSEKLRVEKSLGSKLDNPFF